MRKRDMELALFGLRELRKEWPWRTPERRVSFMEGPVFGFLGWM